MSSNKAPSFVVEIGAALQDSTLSPEQTADRIVSLCRTAVRESPETSRGDDDTDTPGLEMFLWQAWGALITLAEEDSSYHDRLASILFEIKSRGREDWTLWDTPFDWANLPVFGLCARENMNGASCLLRHTKLTFIVTSGPQPDGQNRRTVARDPEYLAALSGGPPVDSAASRAGAHARLKWLNMNAFLARLWVLDVWDCAFYGISTMRMSLEPHSLPSDSSQSHVGQPSVELDFEVAALWVRVAGKRMFECREILGPKGNPDWPPNRGCPGGSGGTWDGVDGYHPERWQHWKTIFRDISQGQWRRNVIDAAKVCNFASIEDKGTQATYRQRLRSWNKSSGRPSRLRNQISQILSLTLLEIPKLTESPNNTCPAYLPIGCLQCSQYLDAGSVLQKSWASYVASPRHI